MEVEAGVLVCRVDDEDFLFAGARVQPGKTPLGRPERLKGKLAEAIGTGRHLVVHVSIKPVWEPGD
jgi:hypothetical protein